MKLICVVDMFLCRPPFGGPHTFLVHLTRRLAAKSWAVVVITEPGADHTLLDALRGAGTSIIADLWRTADVPEVSVGRLEDWLTRVQPDIFLVTGCASASWLALPRLPSTIHTVSVAHADLHAYLEPAGYYARFLDAMVGVSETITEHLRQSSPDDAGRCQYVPYGVKTLDVAGYNARATLPRPGPLRLGYLGRLVEPHKRVLWYPRLLSRLGTLGLDFRFQFIGDGPERTALEALVRSEGLADRVTLRGWLSGEALSEAIREIDVTLLLSDTEGLPLAMLESMGQGCVPIVSDIDSGMRNIVREGENGFLVPFDDLNAQCSAILRLDQDREFLRRLSRAAWETSQGYTVERMVDAYEALFQDLLVGRLKRSQVTPVRDVPPMPSCRSKYPLWLRKLKARLVVR